MMKHIKILNVTMLLCLGMMTGQPVVAMDSPSQEATSGLSLPTLYHSKKTETNDLLDKDPLKKFAYQEKRYAKDALLSCKCSNCSTYYNEAKQLWKKVRIADTSTSEVKKLFQDFVNLYDVRMHPRMKQWINNQDFIIKAEEESQDIDRLYSDFVPLFLLDLEGKVEEGSAIGKKLERITQRLLAHKSEQMGIKEGKKDVIFAEIVQELHKRNPSLQQEIEKIFLKQILEYSINCVTVQD